MAREFEQMTRVRDARSGLLLTHPFFGVLSLKLDLEESSAVPTCVVNAKRIAFNPAYIETLSNSELKGLVAHEVMHLALLHHARQGVRDTAMWNDAGDYAINSGLLADGFTLPKGAYVDARFDGMSAEKIYTTLRDEKEQEQEEQKQKGGGGQGQGQPQPSQGQGHGQPDPQGQPMPGAGNPCGTFEAAGPADSAAAAEAAAEWQENANEAMRAASSAGKLPAGLKRTVTEAIVAKADYETLFRRFMLDQIRTRSTWNKRNKRFPDVYLPGRVRDGMGCMVFAIDTSGSMSQPALNRCARIAQDVVEELEPAAVHVMYADTQVTRVDTFEHGDTLTMEAIGGGGTRFTPVFERVESEGWTPAVLVYLTDLDAPDFPADPGYPVLWLSYGAAGKVAPMGETIAVD